MIAANFLRQHRRGVEVKWAIAKEGTIVETVSGSGRIQSEVGVKVSAQVAGKIVKLYGKEGERVKRGDILVQLDREIYQAGVERAQSNLESANAQYEKTKAEVLRLRELANKKLISTSELEAGEALLLQNTSAVEQAKAMLKESKDMLSKTTIVAPVDGVITEIRKKEGELTLGAQFQEDVILVISDLGKMAVECDIDESDVVKVAIGDCTRVLVDAFPDCVLIGRVTEIAHSAQIIARGTQDQVTNFTVKVRLENPLNGLRPGMSATVDIVTDLLENAIIVPIQAITVRQETLEKMDIEQTGEITTQAQKRLSDRLKREKLPEIVFRLENGKARKVPVSTGIASNLDIQVKNSISVGDTIITGPYRLISKDLKDGDYVYPEDIKKKEKERLKRLKENR
ncbi:MAG: efflux RND transporter periplasmic adaptor subunit [bacterium]|nr:efflux RND transporter periplasmic adaptor subunit [bacterium]